MQMVHRLHFEKQGPRACVVYQKCPEDLSNAESWAPSSEFLLQWVCIGGLRICMPTNFPLLLVQGPYFENHWLRLFQ